MRALTWWLVLMPLAVWAGVAAGLAFASEPLLAIGVAIAIVFAMVIVWDNVTAAAEKWSRAIS